MIGKTFWVNINLAKNSSNKTIEGCIGGTIGAVVIILALRTYICNIYYFNSVHHTYILH